MLLTYMYNYIQLYYYNCIHIQLRITIMYTRTLQDINILLTYMYNYVQLYYYNCIYIITYYNYIHTLQVTESYTYIYIYIYVHTHTHTPYIYNYIITLQLYTNTCTHYNAYNYRRTLSQFSARKNIKVQEHKALQLLAGMNIKVIYIIYS